MSARIVIEHVGVRFELDRQKRPMTPAVRRLRSHTATHWGLRGISWQVSAGSRVALTGPNGVGKTTLLRLIAGVFVPDEGRVEIHGRVGSLLATNAGLMPRLTGRENAMLLGVLAGLRKREARSALEPIQARTELGSAFDRPISTYSQGMRARLGFAVLEETRPDVLLLDEVHEAIDGVFRRYVESYVSGLCRRGGIVVAAGHDHTELARMCSEAVRLDSLGLHRVEDWPGEGAITAGQLPDPEVAGARISGA